MSSITANSKTTTFGYDAASRRTSATWPNGSTATYGYDSADQLTNLIHKTSSGSTIASFQYRYDANGNRTNLVTQEGSFRFDYDAVNWLVAATYPGNRTQYFDYDDVGNRTNLVDITGTTTNRTRATYNAANRLTQTISGTVTNLYRYDGAGRLTNHVVAGRNRWLGYDFRSQMRSLTDTNSTAYAYEFDGDGNRRKETIAGTTKKFIYDGPNILMELDNANTIQALYVSGLGIDQPIEKISYVGGAADGRFVYHTDALGSVFAMTDDLQSTVQSYTYEAFGKLRSATGPGPVGGNRFTYTAREPLGDTQSFYYYRWRVMDPNVGRFTSEDPLGFVDGVGLYSYVQNKPLEAIDPHGELSLGPIVTIIRVLAGMIFGDCSGVPVGTETAPVAVSGSCYRECRPMPGTSECPNCPNTYGHGHGEAIYRCEHTPTGRRFMFNRWVAPPFCDARDCNSSGSSSGFLCVQAAIHMNF